MSTTTANRLTIRALDVREATEAMPRLEAFAMGDGPTPLSRHPAWASVLQEGLRHRAVILEAVEDGRTRGILALAEVRSLLFGRFLVSLPYLNYGGPIADDGQIALALVHHAASHWPTLPGSIIWSFATSRESNTRLVAQLDGQS